MVSYYNPVAMFGRTGTGHHHHHHTSPASNPYFTPAAYGGYPHHHHHQGAAPNPSVGVTSTQFSPNMAPEFSHQYPHQFGHMTSADTSAAIAAAPWNHYSACHRNIATGYEEWTHQHGHHHVHPSSFYSHQQPSPPSSTPSPNSSHTLGAPNNNNNTSSSNNVTHSPSSVYNASSSFKTEFGPCSSGNPQESSAEMQSQGPVVSSAGPSIGRPHSPDSGMAISDGVSSSGSPATGVGAGQQQHCLGGGGAHHLNQALNGGLIGSQQNTNLNQQSLHPQRPAQARSPFEWMKKPSYNVTTNNGKTRTKDKYRVVYSDTQRLELEKEFHYSRYITIRRKAELASILGLSERQVKIWFQNRRAKERKVVRKREEMIHREKIATMVHMQSAVVGMPQVGGPMCNQGNGNSIAPLM